MKNIVEALFRSTMVRQNGKTYALIQAMKVNPKVCMLVMDRGEAERLSKQYDIDINRFYDARNPKSMEGVTTPFIVSDSVISHVAYQYMEDLKKVDEK